MWTGPHSLSLAPLSHSHLLPSAPYSLLLSSLLPLPSLHVLQPCLPPSSEFLLISILPSSLLLTRLLFLPLSQILLTFCPSLPLFPLLLFLLSHRKLGQLCVNADEKWCSVFQECWSQLGCEETGRGCTPQAWENIALALSASHQRPLQDRCYCCRWFSHCLKLHSLGLADYVCVCVCVCAGLAVQEPQQDPAQIRGLSAPRTNQHGEIPQHPPLPYQGKTRIWIILPPSLCLLSPSPRALLCCPS